MVFMAKTYIFFDGMGSADLIARSTPEAPKAFIREDSSTPGMFYGFVGSWNLDIQAT